MNNYSYPAVFGNGTTLIVKGLGINSTDITVSMSALNAYGLPITPYNGFTGIGPYWLVKVPLDKIYPQEVNEVDVQLRADNGTVFGAQRQYAPYIHITSYSPLPFYPQSDVAVLEILLTILLALIVSIAILLIILCRIFRQS